MQKLADPANAFSLPSGQVSQLREEVRRVRGGVGETLVGAHGCAAGK